ncbi:unnamed protein product, partial [marine sediment metagenome]
GYALQPSGIRGKNASQLSHPLAYYVMSEEATGRKNQDLVLRLLAKMTTKEINTKHAVGSTHLGILKSQADYEPYKKKRALAETLYMLDYAFYQPNHPYYSMWWNAVWNNMELAENGKLSPEAAADKAIELMKVEIGDELIIE